MEIVLWSLLAGVLGGAAAFGVLRALVRRDKTVDELAIEVERLSRIVKRYQMQRVREAALPDSQDPAEIVPPDALRPGTSPTAGMTVKHDLRKRMLS